jgi:hypothetical protein
MLTRDLAPEIRVRMLDYEYSSNSTYYHVSIDTLPYNIYHSGADRKRTEEKSYYKAWTGGQLPVLLTRRQKKGTHFVQ